MNTFIKSSLRGSGQVLFQENAISGFFFLVAVFIASAGTGFYALTGLIVSTLLGRIWKGDTADYRAGLYGYNGMLIGAMAGSIILEFNILIALLGPVCALCLQFLFKNLFPKIPVLTFPFVLVSWVAINLVTPLKTTSVNLNPIDLFFQNFSQIFLVGNTLSGGLIVLGIAVSSRSAVSWSVVAAILTKVVNDICNVEMFGFSAILAAVALGSVYEIKYKMAFTFIGILSVALIHIGTSGLPVFTGPFIMVVWIIWLIGQKQKRA